MRSLPVVLAEMEQVSRDSEDDPEAAHSRADDLLIETIRILSARLTASKRGTAENIIQHFRESAKWYA